MNIAIVVAAGEGLRFGRQGGKQYINLVGKPLLAYSILALENAESVDGIIIVTNADRVDFCFEHVVNPFAEKVIDVVVGGDRRQESVYRGLKSLPAGAQKVIIHDGARPLITPKWIDKVASVCSPENGAVLAVPVADTVKSVEDGLIKETLDRNQLWLAQTPQIFSHPIILQAHQNAGETGFIGTDDASLVERIGHPVSVVMGGYDNIKVTNPTDLIIAEALLLERMGI